MQTVSIQDFADFREKARAALAAGTNPRDILFSDTADAPSLFADDAAIGNASTQITVNVPRDFVALAQTVAAHNDPEKWMLLYQALFRITHGEHHLLKLGTDPLVHRLDRMEKEIRRDCHKTKAFVRFRKVEDDTGEHYIAFHRPDHKILSLVAGFFKTRFGVMRWTIMTPNQTLDWDGEKLRFSDGVGPEAAPDEDKLEDLWRDYYRATFNPARIKIKAMKREMPVRHWATLPETRIISDLLAEAPERVEKMIATQEGNRLSAAEFLPAEISFPALKQAAAHCKGCQLYECATQTVFGEGPVDAELMLVGEQPGNDEDLKGRAFVGPAGKLLDKAFAEAGLDRKTVYITNAVKHFKFRLERERRMHQSPDAKEIIACKPWLLAETELVKPKIILCLGATAGRSLIGHGFTLKKTHGKWFDSPHGGKITATYHPSAALRSQAYDPDNQIFETIVEDLKKVKNALLKS